MDRVELGWAVKNISTTVQIHSRFIHQLAHLSFYGGGMAALFAYFCIPAYSDVKMQRSYVKCIPVGPIESFSASVLDFNIIRFLLDSL